jgi:hypothetical protein
MGEWGRAVFKSIGWTFLYIVLYLAYELGAPGYSSIGSFLALMYFSAMIYLTFSFFGWLLIGFPIHWAICKWASPRFEYYPIGALLVNSILFATLGIESTPTFGVAILIQSILFRYYAYK